MRNHSAVAAPLASRLPAAAEPCFKLGINAAGLWVIRESTGRKGGLFRTREAAIKYARDESADGNFIIVYEPGGLELGSAWLRMAA